MDSLLNQFTTSKSNFLGSRVLFSGFTCQELLYPWCAVSLWLCVSRLSELLWLIWLVDVKVFSLKGTGSSCVKNFDTKLQQFYPGIVQGPSQPLILVKKKVSTIYKVKCCILSKAFFSAVILSQETLTERLNLHRRTLGLILLLL